MANRTKKLEYVDPNDVIIIGLDTDDDEKHPLYDERINFALDDKLVANIMVLGVRDAVEVREEAGKLYVIDGRQRTRAVRDIRRRQELEGSEEKIYLPILKVNGDDNRMIAIAHSKNVHRKSDDVLTNARKAARQFDFCGDLDMVAVTFGRSRTTINNWFSLLEADTSVIEAVEDGKISANRGIELASYPKNEQVEKLRLLIKGAEREATVADSTPASTPTSSAGNNGADLPPEPGETNGKKASSPKRSGQVATQKGVKRVWLRKALKSEAAKKLTDEQMGVLKWMATGEADKNTWYDDFYFEASAEIGE